MSTTEPADWRPTAPLEVLRLRARLLGQLRSYFASTGSLEVETPVLVGAAVTDLHLESLAVQRTDGTNLGYLQTSPEYAMKRLLCAGAPDIFQVARVFREGERGRNHNPEFTMIEWYRLGMDHLDLVRDVEALLRRLLEPFREVGPSRIVTYSDAFRDCLGCDPLQVTAGDLGACLRERGTDVPASLAADRDSLLDLAMATHVTPGFAIDRLTFVHDFPASQAALARIRGPVASRFEAFWGGLELANGFHELDDQAEQSRRFVDDLAARARHGRPRREPDRRFLDALAAGLPSCAGVALGFDRVVMVAVGARRIDEVIAFPIERA
jgi:lysyl-tRNA synthetase class 2